MNGISKNELKLVSDMEFRKKYYFCLKDIAFHFVNQKQMRNTIYTLRKKGRIIRLSKNKYFLVPIKARHGKWTDYPLIIVDEMFNGQDYFVGGWYAAHYWRLTDQIPMQVDVFTTKRQGKINLLNSRFVFHRTTAQRIKTKSIVREIGKHHFKILSKREATKWMKSRR